MDYKLYDKALGALTSHLLYLANQHDGIIQLGSFDPRNKAHLCALQCANFVRDVISTTIIKIEMPFFPWLFHKKFRDCQRARCTEKTNTLLKVVEEANQFNPTIWEEIYNAYYNKRRRS